MASRSRSPRRAGLTRAIRGAPRATLQRCLLKRREAGALPEEVRCALLALPGVQPQSDEFMIRTMFNDCPVSLPASVFGELLSPKAKHCLQSVSREWRDLVRMPSLWRALCFRSFRGTPSNSSPT